MKMAWFVRIATMKATKTPSNLEESGHGAW